MKVDKATQKQSLAYLRKICKPGTRVYTIVRHVSRSGMSRLIDVYTIRQNRPIYLSGHVAFALGMARDHKTGALRVRGCGMDMGYHVVNSMSYRLHGYKSRFKKGQEHQSGYTLLHDRSL